MPQWTEAHAELAKVRAEGDWIMIKIEMEKKELDATLEEIQMAKAQIAALHAAKLQECPTAVTSMDLVKHVKALQTQEERQKGHLSEDLSKLALLRQAIDEARRVRKDALAVEVEEQRRAKLMEATVEATHAEIAAVKQREAATSDLIRQVQADIDTDQAAFFAARKALADQLHECHKQRAQQPNERSHVQAIAGVSTTSHMYKKTSNLSWLRARNKVCLVKRTESLEQKKELLDALLATSKLPSVQCFLDKYNRQEQDKAALCVEIDRQSSQNAAIQAKMQVLEAEKVTLQGNDMHTMEGLNPYCHDIRDEAKKRREHTEKLVADAKQLENLAKKLFDPIEQLYTLTCGTPRSDLPLRDRSLGAKTHLERLALIEEQVTQKVLSKIAHECATHNGNWQQSASLVRLLQSRGVLRPKLVKFPPPLPTSIGASALGHEKAAHDDDADSDDSDGYDGETNVDESADLHEPSPGKAAADDGRPLVALNSKDLLRQLRHAGRAPAASEPSNNRKSLAKSKRRLSTDIRRPSGYGGDAAPASPPKSPASRRASAVAAEVELDSSSMMIVGPSQKPKDRRRSSAASVSHFVGAHGAS